MTGRLAIDFGTSNTVLAVWDADRKEGIPLHLPEYGRQFQQGDETVSVIPSLIHYAAGGRRWIGNQVGQRKLAHSRYTFRWMKRYISHRSPMRVQVDGQEITPFKAGQDFLSTLLLFAAQQLDLHDEEIALSVPVESFEHYENWIANVLASAGFQRYRLIDEPSAAALGYGAHILPGNVYLIFDFGGGTLHTAIVLMESEENAAAGKRCRVLGKAGRSIGGTTIDQWLFSEVLHQANRRDSDEDIRRISGAILVECERVKETLSFQEEAGLSVSDAETGARIEAHFDRRSFEALLDRHELFTEIHQVLRSALNAARERGYDEDAIQAVLMVGGSSQIPAVQQALSQRFGRDKVFFNRPLDAIARGAAAFNAGVDFFDHIQHDYAIRYVDPHQGDYAYRMIVPQGTPYPTQDPVARLAVKASYDGQQQLGIAIFEMGKAARSTAEPNVELVFDPGGAARLIPLTAQEMEQRTQFWMNEQQPTFLQANPPAHQGEPRFEVEFRVDANKRLTINARDLHTDRWVYQDYPVVKLT
ncbi:MAG: Hsp70 family protein [Anaerolineaceae bacterium]|nr:Hsp70 family protein [Anaerolineaceae bacterium]